MAHTASPAQRVAHYRAQLKRLAAEVADVGFISPGSLVQRYTTCGNPACRCAADPPQRHGPYWHWSTAVGGKTINRTVTDEQVPLYQEWIANRRRLRQIVTDIEKISEQATQLILQQTSQGLDPTARTTKKP